jgi:hypothetical protein
MDENRLKVSSFEIAYLFALAHGLIRLISIVIAILFWMLPAVAVSLGVRFGAIEKSTVLAYMQSAWKALSLLGVTAIGAALGSWWVSEKACSLFLKWYADRHLKGRSGDS